ncbi:MAG: NAD(P)-dependent oxidoreductase [Acidobacteria bacterium]|nr:NAD(P)-dependent oxidoreductase [Acidobacteriota bacterium]
MNDEKRDARLADMSSAQSPLSTQHSALSTSSSPRIAVTGAGGFLGRHLAHALVARGANPLLLVHSSLERELPEGLRRVSLDLTERAAVGSVLELERPQIIFHLAGTRGIGAGALTWSRCVELNVDSTVHLLEASQRAGVERVVIIGTADEYGNQPGPLREDLPLAPASPYAVSKTVATQIAQAMHARDGCPVVILRPFTVYGPGQPANMFVSEAIGCAVHGEAFRMTEGRQRRDLIYVDDAIDAFIAAAEAPGVEGQVINVGSGEAYALRDVARMVWRLSGTDAELMIGARAGAAAELHDTWADVTRAKELLGWSPRVGLEVGLAKMIEWVRGRRSAEC